MNADYFWGKVIGGNEKRQTKKKKRLAKNTHAMLEDRGRILTGLVWGGVLVGIVWEGGGKGGAVLSGGVSEGGLGG